jgi:hypothetical protein
MEKAGVPGVAINTTTFLADGLSSAKVNGMPLLRIVTVDARGWYMARSTPAEMTRVTASIFDKMMDALTRPLTREEGAAQEAEAKLPNIPIKFSGTSYTECLEAMNDYFIKNQMSDGLPFVPPTKEAVDWMLSGTSRSRNEVIGVPVLPSYGIATIEKIAVSSVMAGAKPEYLPIIIAAVEIITPGEEKFMITHIQQSASGPSPVIIVNGPIAEEIGLNFDRGYLGTGWRANAAIARAVRLSLQNIGHTWPGETDMSSTGKMAPYAGWCFAENERDLPYNVQVAGSEEKITWPSFAVQHGFKPEDSVVTIASANYFAPKAGGGAVSPMSPYEQLVLTSKMMAELQGGGTTLPFTDPLGTHLEAHYLIGLHPEEARRLAEAGFTKEELQRWLFFQARLKLTDLTEYEQNKVKKMEANNELWFAGGLAGIRNAQLSIPVTSGPDQIHLVVAGGTPGYNVIWAYDHGARGFGMKKITGATITKSGK